MASHPMQTIHCKNQVVVFKQKMNENGLIITCLIYSLTVILLTRLNKFIILITTSIRSVIYPFEKLLLYDLSLCSSEQYEVILEEMSWDNVDSVLCLCKLAGTTISNLCVCNIIKSILNGDQTDWSYLCIKEFYCRPSIRSESNM